MISTHFCNQINLFVFVKCLGWSVSISFQFFFQSKWWWLQITHNGRNALSKSGKRSTESKVEKFHKIVTSFKKWYKRKESYLSTKNTSSCAKEIPQTKFKEEKKPKIKKEFIIKVLFLKTNKKSGLPASLRWHHFQVENWLL